MLTAGTRVEILVALAEALLFGMASGIGASNGTGGHHGEGGDGHDIVLGRIRPSMALSPRYRNGTKQYFLTRSVVQQLL